MSAEADAVCGAGYREQFKQCVNSVNGYCLRDWDTRAGSIELAIPKARVALPRVAGTSMIRAREACRPPSSAGKGRSVPLATYRSTAFARRRVARGWHRRGPALNRGSTDRT